MYAATNKLLKFHCHVKPYNNQLTALIDFVVDGNTTTLELSPTTNWVVSTTAQGSVVANVPVSLVRSADTVLKFDITSHNTDIIICGYDKDCIFKYATQPIWKDGSCSMDITGHGPDQDLQGPGSLVLPRGVTCSFTAQVRYI